MSQKNSFRTITIGAFVIAIAMVVSFFLGLAANRPEPTVAASTTSAPAASDSSPNEEHSAWQTEKLDDPYTGVMSTTAMDILDGDNSIVVRKSAGKLECYINTGKFLEKSGNFDRRQSMVQYQFDNGKPIRQAWSISDDNQALVCPANPEEFLKQLATAKTFVFEFQPADTAPQLVRYKVSGLPAEFQ